MSVIVQFYYKLYPQVNSLVCFILAFVPFQMVVCQEEKEPSKDNDA